MNEKSILVVKMFAGSYVWENIPHEVINFFRPDGEEGYGIYIPPSGTYGDIASVSDIVFIERAGVGLFRVIGKAHLSGEKGPDSLTYGGKPLRDILSFSLLGRDEANYGAWADDVRRIKSKEFIFLCGGRKSAGLEKGQTVYYFNFPEGNNSNPSGSAFGHQSRIFLNPSMMGEGTINNEEKKLETHGYKILHDLIEDSSLWEEKPAGTVKESLSEIPCLPKNTFLDAINKGTDEVCASNYLAYIFEHNKQGLCDFFKSREKQVILNPDDLFILREFHHIDLLILSTDPIKNNPVCIAIENKIYSQINGVDKQRTNNSKKVSQLSHYYDVIIHPQNHLSKKEMKTQAGQILQACYEQNKHFYILHSIKRTPAIDLSHFKNGKKYDFIDYGELAQFFSKHPVSTADPDTKGVRTYTQEFVDFLLEISYGDHEIAMARFRKKIDC